MSNLNRKPHRVTPRLVRALCYVLPQPMAAKLWRESEDGAMEARLCESEGKIKVQLCRPETERWHTYCDYDTAVKAGIYINKYA